MSDARTTDKTTDKTMGEVRHFLDLDVLPTAVLRKIIDTSKALEAGRSTPTAIASRWPTRRWR